MRRWICGVAAWVLAGCSGSVAVVVGDGGGPVTDGGGGTDARADGGEIAACRAHGSQASCAADARCTYDPGCPDCRGGTTGALCLWKGEPQRGSNCAACPGPCGALPDEASCASSPACHPVYRDPGTCDCASAGCCMRFSGCADGAKAQCSPSNGPQCAIPPPECGGDYVVSYTISCYEGCVHKAECL